MMATKLVETELPIVCIWCSKPLHAYLDVGTGNRAGDTSLILCPACDAPTAPLVRRRVVSFGHLEERDDVFVWVEGRRPTDHAEGKGPKTSDSEPSEAEVRRRS